MWFLEIFIFQAWLSKQMELIIIWKILAAYFITSICF